MFTSIRARLFAMITGLILLATVFSVFLFDYVATQNAKALIKENFSTNEYYVDAIVEERFARLRESAFHAASDFAFKTAVNTKSKSTVFSALSSLNQRLQANFVAVQSLDREFFVSVNNAVGDDEIKRALRPILQPNLQGRHHVKTGIVSIGSTLYQVTGVPINAPTTIAYIVIAFALDELFTEDIKKLAATDISFLAVEKSTGKPLYVSTVVDFNPPDLNDYEAKATKDGVVLYNGMMTRVIELAQDNANLDFYIVLQKDWAATLKSYTQHKPYLIGIMLALVLASVPLVHVLSVSVTRPFRKLVKASEEMLEGNYTVNIGINNKDEIGALARRLEELLQGLIERDRLEFIAYHDFATGLPNRKFMNEKMMKALTRQRDEDAVSTLLFIRLINFGDSIKSYTKEQADSLIKQVGERLMDMSIGEEDVMAKIGDSSFGVLMTGVSSKTILEQKAEGLIRFLRAPFVLPQGGTIEFDVSVGIAYSTGFTEPNTWLNVADAACTKASEGGNANTYQFNDLELED